MAGAPAGNNNARKARISTEALRMELARIEKDENRSALRDMWRKQIEKAENGDLQSFTAINDRLEGKPAQAIVGGDEDDSPVKITGVIELVRPK